MTNSNFTKEKHLKGETRPVLERFQDFCKTLSPFFCFYVCKKKCVGYFVIQSSNHQKLKEQIMVEPAVVAELVSALYSLERYHTQRSRVRIRALPKFFRERSNKNELIRDFYAY